jgi:hypothetical protein
MAKKQQQRPALAPIAERRRRLMHAERTRALASNDPAAVRAWAARWDVPLLPCSDAELMQSIAEARRVEGMADASPHAMEAACWDVARGIVAQPPAVAHALIASLDASEPTEPLRREMDRLIATMCRRLLPTP